MNKYVYSWKKKNNYKQYLPAHVEKSFFCFMIVSLLTFKGIIPVHWLCCRMRTTMGYFFYQNPSPPSTGRPLGRSACYQKTHCSAAYPDTWPTLTNCLFIDGSITTTTTPFICHEKRCHSYTVSCIDKNCVEETN